MSLSMVMCQIWCVKLQISDSILQKLKIVGVISLISLIKFFLKIVHNLEGNKSVFSSIKEGVINYWKLSKGRFLQSPFKSSQVTLLARNRPWTSLDRPNSNSEYSGAVRKRSEIHPKTVFLSICLGSHECLVTLSSCISQKSHKPSPNAVREASRTVLWPSLFAECKTAQNYFQLRANMYPQPHCQTVRLWLFVHCTPHHEIARWCHWDHFQTLKIL